MIRLVALDLDGTLLNTHDGLSEVNARAIRHVRDRGVVIVLCTSRWFSLAVGTAQQLGLRGPPNLPQRGPGEGTGRRI
jgi:hydroxymethylpyrimidine pyrophosphatase-like HAD family hydrolase